MVNMNVKLQSGEIEISMVKGIGMDWNDLN